MDIYNANKSKIPKRPRGKKIGWIIFFVWIISLTAFISFVASKPPSDVIAHIVGPATFFGALLLPPVWGFLLGNKLVKIISVIPVILVVLFFITYLFILRPQKTMGSSMEPNFVAGEYVLSEKVTYYFNSPKRGDVIVFSPPYDSSSDFFARVIGLPGEYISIRKDHVYINNKILNEPYITKGVETKPGFLMGEENTLIPKDGYFVLGDNRNHSSDSRSYGFVQKSSIKGRFWYIYWPGARKGLVKNPL